MKHLFSFGFLLLLFGCSANPVQTQPEPQVQAPSQSLAETEAEPITEKEDETGSPVPVEGAVRGPASAKNVTLVLGDSHMVGEYGDALLHHMEMKSDVLMIANCGAGSYTFTATPIKRPCGRKKFETVVVRRAPESLVAQMDPMESLALTAQELNPNIVVIGLGTNYDNISSDSIKHMTEILVQNAPAMSKLIWLGPPYFIKKGGDSIPVVNSIRRVFGLADKLRGEYETSTRNIDVVFADSTHFNKRRHPLSIPKRDFHFYGKLIGEWADYTWKVIGDEF